MIDAKELERFYRDVEDKLIGPEPEKRSYLDGLKQNIREYMQANPQCTIADVEQEFGPADQVADLFLSLSENAVVQESVAARHRQTRTKTIFFIVAAILLAILLSLEAFRIGNAHPDSRAEGSPSVTGNAIYPTTERK